MAIRNKQSNSSGILITLIAVVIAGAIFYLMGWPAIKDLKKVNQDLAVAEANKKAANAYITGIQAAYGKVAAIQSQLEILDIAAPINPDLPEALIQINEIVNNNKLNLETLAPSTGTGGKIKIGLTVTGSYAQLKQCLSDMEVNLRPIIVESVLMSSQKDDKGSSSTGGSYSIVMTYVGTGKLAGNGSQAGPTAGGAPAQGGASDSNSAGTSGAVQNQTSPASNTAGSTNTAGVNAPAGNSSGNSTTAQGGTNGQ